ncbi:hypothetical protein SALWKB12_0008 [Snodgrassella communis]|uniref:Uncharacterized protein n=1 Tax=Snodgrassella communis TaxID=2946699 RepID=A0A836Z4W0_9NEIS|nr:hypothetical protein SALWKB12_0008 [Snodgrassella communis]KDN14381.1 hypothetical protein SALWKB29_1470 [Snodgrassella communis]
MALCCAATGRGFAQQLSQQGVTTVVGDATNNPVSRQSASWPVTIR